MRAVRLFLPLSFLDQYDGMFACARCKVVQAHVKTCRARVKKCLVDAGEAVIAGEPGESRSSVCEVGTLGERGESGKSGKFQRQSPGNRDTHPRARTR